MISANENEKMIYCCCLNAFTSFWDLISVPEVKMSLSIFQITNVEN